MSNTNYSFPVPDDFTNDQQILDAYESYLVDSLANVPNVSNPTFEIVFKNPATGVEYPTSWVMYNPSYLYERMPDGTHSTEPIEVPTFTIAGERFVISAEENGTPPQGSTLARFVGEDTGYHPDGRRKKHLILNSVVSFELVEMLRSMYPDVPHKDAFKSMQANSKGQCTSISAFDAMHISNMIMKYLIEYGGEEFKHLQQILTPYYESNPYFTKDEDVCGVCLPEVNQWLVVARGGYKTQCFTYLGTDEYSDYSDEAKPVTNELGVGNVAAGAWMWSQTPGDLLDESIDNSFVIKTLDDYPSVAGCILRMLSIATKKFNFYVDTREVSTEFFIRYIKTRYESLKRLSNEILLNNILPWGFQFVMGRSFVEAEPFTLADMLNTENAEERRLIFSVLPADALSGLLQQSVKSSKLVYENTRYSVKEGTYIQAIDTVYTLHKVPLSVLGIEFSEDDIQNFPGDDRTIGEYCSIVRVSCPSTDRQYLLYVDNKFVHDPSLTVLDAVASTFPIDVPVEYITRIFRQGDVLAVGTKANAPTVQPYTLTGEQFYNLIVTEV